MSSFVEGLPETSAGHPSQHDLEFARRIQRDLMPGSLVGTSAFRLDVHHHPHDLIGSDFYDRIPLEGNRFGILVADVRGHGLSAALYTMLLKSLEEKFAVQNSDPSAFVAGLNRELARYTVDDSVATAVYAVIDPDRGSLHYCSAGHPPLLVYRASTGEVTSLVSDGMPLGFYQEEQYMVREAVLDRGDLVLFYTDGLTETGGQGNSNIGETGLVELLRQEIIDRSMDLPKRIYDRVLALSGKTTLDDDALVLSLRRR
jgi:sigma-B regulation protein RsbU (phosphoserine phosphatase)